LNTLFNYSARSWGALDTIFILEIDSQPVFGIGTVEPADARQVTHTCDIWVTDPPYADAIVYHELTEFFLAWLDGGMLRFAPTWHTDSKRALAVKGSDEAFRRSMVDCYRNLTTHMPDNGAQIVMFTHQDVGVWADLTLILWAAGLRVTSAWCIATETDTALKEGNYVQGTVLLVLRKQTSQDTAFLDEVVPEVEDAVKAQLDSMLKLDDQEDPNFGDTDYQLAAYAAALRVLTKYRSIEDIDVSYELSKTRKKGEASPIEAVISDAVKTACDHLVPKGFDQFTWKTLTPEERFYLKGLDLESHQEFRNPVSGGRYRPEVGARHITSRSAACDQRLGFLAVPRLKDGKAPGN
jgi:adenine-specific DNA methylase